MTDPTRPDRETELLRLRPAWVAIFAAFSPFMAPAIFLLASWAFLEFVLQNPFAPARIIGLWMLGGSVFMGFLLRWSRLYRLTSERIMVDAGLIRRVHYEVPLRNIQHFGVSRSLIERLTGTGTLTVTDSGASEPTLGWIMIQRPMQVIEVLRGSIDARQHSGVAAATRSEMPTPVIGLVGGIGSGKSAVAAVLGRAGCHVIDSDVESRKALERAEVIAALVSWWGPEILRTDGAVDRRKVGEIVFNDSRERLRLEGLIHPLVRSDRSKVIQGAKDAGKVAVVLDAPLLFEAGSDAICDAVFFVDAPLEQRQERVKARGWSEEELQRRESSQLPLDEKRRRSTHVISNAGSLEELENATREALDAVLEGRSSRGSDRGSTR